MIPCSIVNYEESDSFNDETNSVPVLISEGNAIPAVSDPQKNSCTELIAQKVAIVLNDRMALGEKRARACGQDDFLKFLLVFNKEAIHFTKSLPLYLLLQSSCFCMIFERLSNMTE